MPLTRRDLVRAAAVAGTVTAAGGLQVTGASTAAAATPPSTTWVVPLLERFTYGATPASIAAAKALGTPTDWLNQQLAPAKLADPEGDAVRALYPEARWDVPTTRSRIQEFSWTSMFALGQATIGQAAWSRRQLYEVMVDFWSNHLNVTNPSDGVWDNRADYDRRVIRRYALGRFSDMLVASATHPAMLRYLNQAESTKSAPNENYARELLELHTVGVRSGYTEEHVRAASRLLTGWTVNDSGAAVYEPSRHWTGPVRILGFSHANGSADGRAAMTAYLRYLAMHPSTARRIARKLAIRFVSDSPPAALVDSLAKLYLANGSDVRPLLRRIALGSEWKAGHKYKTPYEDVLSTVRVLGIKLLPSTKSAAQRRKGLESLYWTLDGLSMPPFAWGLPDGYPDVVAGWQGADLVLRRWNTHQSLAAAWWPSRSQLTIPSSRSLLPTRLPTTYGGLVDALSVRLLHHRLGTAARGALLAFMGGSATSPLRTDSEWLRWRLPYLVALVLDTPAFQERR